MKKTCVTFAACCLLSMGIFAQKAEENAIKVLLDSETAAFTRISFAEVVKKYWVMDDQTLMLATLPDGNHLRMTLEDLLSMTETPIDDPSVAVKSDFQFSISGNTAVVSFSQEVDLEGDQKSYSHEIRFLEKVDGVWKIHISSVHQYIPKGRE